MVEKALPRLQAGNISGIPPNFTERSEIKFDPSDQYQIISLVGSAAARLLRSSFNEQDIIEILAALGQAADVSCCVLFEIDSTSSRTSAHSRFVWHKPGLSLLDPIIPLEPFILRIGQAQDGLFLENTLTNQAKADKQPYSLAILPTHLAAPKESFIGLIDTQKEQAWPVMLRDALKISANLIGSIIEHGHFDEKIRENEIRNRVIIDWLPDLVIRIEASGKILDYTARQDHPLFIERDVITGKFLADIWPRAIVNKIVPGKKKKRFLKPQILDEFKLPFSNKVYESRLDPINPQEALIVIRDVTEQSELKRMKSDFINHASHELRTPVTASILMAELIQEGGLPQEIEEYWQILNSELNRQKILIDRLLIAGRLESGMMHLEIAPTELLPILRESIAAVMPISRKKHILIECSVPESTPKILGDKSGLEQVFINLINNAIKFSPEGSKVKIDVTHEKLCVLVAIADEGIGIPAHETVHLFERFFRARVATIAEIPGSGVGLYIVKSILEGLGGDIQLTSSSSLGTTFTVTLRTAK